MQGTKKTLALAAMVSVVVSVGSVSVYNSLGTVETEPGETVGVTESATGVIELSVALEEMRAELKDTRAAMEALETRTEKRTQELNERLTAVAHASATSTAHEDLDPNRELTAEQRQQEITAIAKSFDEIAKLGMAAYASPKLVALAERVRALGEDGAAFVIAELNSEESASRFIAAAMAEKLKDPAMIEPLEQASLDDEDFMVRRMSSHALAFMDHEDAGDSLLRIVEKESRDNGVRINAWFGLATLGRPEAGRLFDKVLSEAGGDIPADFVVDTALKISNPNLLPALRRAYDNASVTTATKARIIRTLGKAEDPEYLSFLREVAADSSIDAILRKAAAEALGEN